jgi:glycosyltransferase involved in cell wall biosynthesis
MSNGDDVEIRAGMRRSRAAPRVWAGYASLSATTKPQLHPVVITRDASRTIAETLTSLRGFPEVVVYDNGSTDDTVAICGRFANVRVEHGEFFGFGPTKNHAASLASGPWILSIDADERVDAELLAELDALDLSEPRRAYALDRRNLLLGKHVRHGGWGDNWLVRVYNRGVCRFSDARVHEKVVVPSGVALVRLEGGLWHDAVCDIDQFLEKMSFYSELCRGPGSKLRSIPHIMLGASWAFFRSYVLRLGFLEGWRGLLIAHCDAQGSFFKHFKRYVDSQNQTSEVSRPAAWATRTKSSASTSAGSAPRR